MLSRKLQEENQKLWDRNSALEDEIKDLKFPLSASEIGKQRKEQTTKKKAYIPITVWDCRLQ